MIGISAPAKTGKTYTALHLAQLLARAAGKPVMMIDTDSGRGLKYADRPDVYPDLNPYLYLRLDPPAFLRTLPGSDQGRLHCRGRLHCGRYRIG